MSSKRKKVAVVGSGPAGLMAATQLVSRADVTLFEKRPSLGRKLLIAGSSGLNISHHLDLQTFAEHYEQPSLDFWKGVLGHYGQKNWVQFIEQELGLETFLGTSDRYFVREMKASGLLKKWTEWLKSRGCVIQTLAELTDFSEITQGSEPGIQLRFGNDLHTFEDAIFALGGGSWEDEEPKWVSLFKSKGIGFREFEASNVGYEVEWLPEFLKEAEGKPLKKIRLTSALGSKEGELVVTRYGLEGTPIYFKGCPGTAFVDLKPDLTLEEVMVRLQQVKENLSPMRRVKKNLNLCEASLALVFHHSDPKTKNDLNVLAKQVKNFPIPLLKARPLSESISSKGGVLWTELEPSLQLKKFPHVHCCGEMIDWDAPTGGFLIQGCVSMGAWIGNRIIRP